MKKLSTLLLALGVGFGLPAMAETQTTNVAAPIVANPQAVVAQQTQPQTTQTVATTATNTVVANVNQVNINSATAAEIQDKLIGIGAKKAQAIVDYRVKNGHFASIEQLTEVSGIGKATLEKNRDRIVLQ